MKEGQMLVHFIGDVHGDFVQLQRILKETKADLHIQVGDMGYFPNLGMYLPTCVQSKSPVWFIDGNHDDYLALKSLSMMENGDNCSVPFIFRDRGEAISYRGITFVFCGGGLSIDKDRRTEGVDWFKEEIPSYQEMQMFYGNIEALRPDIIVTHDAPQSFMSSMRGQLSPKMESPVAKDLDFILKEIKHECFWVCGHMHPETVIMKKINGVTLICVPPVHDSVKGMKPFRSCQGVVLDITKKERDSIVDSIASISTGDNSNDDSNLVQIAK